MHLFEDHTENSLCSQKSLTCSGQSLNADGNSWSYQNLKSFSESGREAFAM